MVSLVLAQTPNRNTGHKSQSLTSSPCVRSMPHHPVLTVRITKRFTFEAAHAFDHKDDDHPFSRLHGHSFEGLVTVSGPADAPANAHGGFVHDLWDLKSIIAQHTADFDHAFLNDIKDLPTPSLENMALTIFNRLAAHLPGLETVEIRRPSCGESASVSRAPNATATAPAPPNQQE